MDRHDVWSIIILKQYSNGVAEMQMASNRVYGAMLMSLNHGMRFRREMKPLHEESEVGM